MMTPNPAPAPMPPMQGPLPPQPMPPQSPPIAPPMQMPMMQQAGTTFNVTIRRTIKEGRIHIENIPPEYVIFSKGSKDLESARISGYRMRRTVTQLLDEGFSKKDLEDIPTSDTFAGNSPEEMARWRDESGVTSWSDTGEPQDKSRMEVWVTVLFTRVDYDGDGKAELRMITRLGDVKGKIIANEEVDENDLCSLTPIIMPHKLVGRSVAELVMDVQLVKTAVLRQTLDAMYLTTDPRMKVMKNQGVDLDALLNSTPGGAVMMDRLDAVEPLQNERLNGDTFKMLEYYDSVRETRTGVTRYNQGLDADSLNKTATGISMIQGASQQRLELIARIFAETGVIKLFKSILRLTIKHQDKERVIRLRDEWVKFDPRHWNADMDCTIAVGLGAGSRESMLNQSMALLNTQMEVLKMGLPIVTPENVYHNCTKIAENAGHKDADLFFTDPKKVKEMQQGQPHKPSPEEMQAQMEQQKMQGQMQLEQAKMGMDQQKTQAQMQMEREKLQMQMELEAQKHMATLQSTERMKQLEIATKAQGQSEMAAMSAKPTTNVQVDAQGIMQEVADTLKAMAEANMMASQEQSQAFEQGITMMAQASQTIAQAAAMMAAPKQVIRDANNQIVGVQPIT